MSWPMRENFNHHTLSIKLLRGSSEMPTLEVLCKGAGEDDCTCTEQECQMKNLISDMGWDVIRAAGEIDLARLSARIDWSDAEEPWVDVEP